MTQNVDGEGHVFDLTKKRAFTFGRFGMCVAESSPGFDVDDPRWISTSQHEAPPCQGILGLTTVVTAAAGIGNVLGANTHTSQTSNTSSGPDLSDVLESAGLWRALTVAAVLRRSRTKRGIPGKFDMNQLTARNG